MAGKADVQTHLDARRQALTETFSDWAQPNLSATERTTIVEHYFSNADAGTTRRVSSGNSVLIKARRSDPHRPNVLVLGRHGTSDLASRQSEPASNGISGPGVASRLGPTMAFCEGVQAARQVTDDEPFNLSYLSVGDGDTFTSALSHVFTGNLDAVFATAATNWGGPHPAITTGCRGRVVAELTLTSGADVADYIVSGGVRNPLTNMTQLLGSLRDARGRIALPGFYERAVRPTAQARTALTGSASTANDWAEQLAVARPSGKLSSLERASLWPGVSVLAIETSAADGQTAPGTVRATVAIYLVPDQRHAEIERALRAWFEAQAPADLQPSLRLVESTRPFVVDLESTPVAAQVRAAYRLHNRDAALVPAGAEAGSGELAFGLGAPVAFAGIAPPTSSTGTTAEHLDWGDFVAGTAMAAETALQMRRL